MKVRNRWDANHYKENSDPQFQCALDAVNQFSFTGNEKVLDLGCGDGKVTAMISARVPDGFVLGLDASSSMISECMRTYHNIPNLSFQLADITNFRVDKKFDLIVSFSAFHWVKDQIAALRNIYEVLEPKGTLVVRMGNGQQPQIVEVFKRDYWKKQMPIQENKFHGKTGEEFSQLLAQCRFENIQPQILSLSQFFPSSNELLNWVMAWVPHATGLSGEKALAFGKDIVDNICAGQHRSGGVVELKSPILAVSAQRPMG